MCTFIFLYITMLINLIKKMNITALKIIFLNAQFELKELKRREQEREEEERRKKEEAAAAEAARLAKATPVTSPDEPPSER